MERFTAPTAKAFAEDVLVLAAGMDAQASKPIVLDELEQALLKL